ncbi:MAG: aryl-sulfate sulfotransferase [Saprospiraceae bacterium]|nr:aryl-sulfate sulfotransferase [Saprospiraceae bacterium]
MKKILPFLALYILLGSTVVAQNTVGLLSYDPMNAYDGYNLMFPHNQPNVYLLNNCGEVVHVWEDEENFRPGNIAYLRPDGTLVKGKRDANVSSDAIWAGGGGEFLEIRDWDNNLIWQFEMNNDSLRLHHDFTLMDNGNIIAVAWEQKSEEEAIQAGRNPASIDQGKIWSEYIFEINPETNEIVWEWHAWDHLIQDFDESKDNFGVITDHPELIDVNYDTHDGHPDWLHINAIDFHELRNQIIISVPYFDEVWIIDHSTSTELAAGNFGGLGGRGGDLMYRWGNPYVYTRDSSMQKQLFFQHDIHFMDDFISPANSNYNALGVFNNRVGADFSTVNIFKPQWDMYTWRYAFDELETKTFFPIDFSFTATHPEEPQKLYSTGLSSFQQLPNDNYLITSGRFGYTYEMTPDNEIVWEYKTPFKGGAQVTQGDSLEINNNLTFRMKRYPADYPAFEGKDFSETTFIELEPDETFCDKILDVEVLEDTYSINVFPNPANNYLIVEWDASMYSNLDIYNALGQKIERIMLTGGRAYLDISNYNPGIHFVLLEGKKVARFIVAN